MPTGFITASASKTAPGTGFQSPSPTGPMIHANLVSGCAACHEAGNTWMGMGAYPISPNYLSPGAQYTGFTDAPRALRAAATRSPTRRTRRPATARSAHGNTTAFTGTDIPGNHIPFSPAATCDNCHTSTDYSVIPTLINIHTYAPSTTTNCQQCHGAAAPTFAIPAVGFSIVGLPRQPHPGADLVRGLPRRPGIVDHRAAGGQRRPVQRLADEPQRHQHQLRQLPRAGPVRRRTSPASLA